MASFLLPTTLTLLAASFAATSESRQSATRLRLPPSVCTTNEEGRLQDTITGILLSTDEAIVVDLAAQLNGCSKSSNAWRIAMSGLVEYLHQAPDWRAAQPIARADAYAAEILARCEGSPEASLYELIRSIKIPYDPVDDPAMSRLVRLGARLKPCRARMATSLERIVEEKLTQNAFIELTQDIQAAGFLIPDAKEFFLRFLSHTDERLRLAALVAVFRMPPEVFSPAELKASYPIVASERERILLELVLHRLSEPELSHPPAPVPPALVYWQNLRGWNSRGAPRLVVNDDGSFLTRVELKSVRVRDMFGPAAFFSVDEEARVSRLSLREILNVHYELFYTFRDRISIQVSLCCVDGPEKFPVITGFGEIPPQTWSPGKAEGIAFSTAEHGEFRFSHASCQADEIEGTGDYCSLEHKRGEDWIPVDGSLNTDSVPLLDLDGSGVPLMLERTHYGTEVHRVWPRVEAITTF